MVGYSPWGCKESDATERLSTAQKRIYLRFSECVCVSVCVVCSVASDSLRPHGL